MLTFSKIDDKPSSTNSFDSNVSHTINEAPLTPADRFTRGFNNGFVEGAGIALGVMAFREIWDIVFDNNTYPNPTKVASTLSGLIGLIAASQSDYRAFFPSAAISERVIRKLQYELALAHDKKLQDDFEEKEQEVDEEYINTHGYSGPNF